jgi:ER lumen protein retaining receptor
LQVLWAFSIFLEAVAIIPQLIVLHAEKVVENVTSHYVATLGVYRAMYIVNWIYKYNVHGTTHWIAWIAGVVQTAFFLDFFYYYFRRWGRVDSLLRAELGAT